MFACSAFWLCFNKRILCCSDLAARRQRWNLFDRRRRGWPRCRRGRLHVMSQCLLAWTAEAALTTQEAAVVEHPGALRVQSPVATLAWPIHRPRYLQHSTVYTRWISAARWKMIATPRRHCKTISLQYFLLVCPSTCPVWRLVNPDHISCRLGLLEIVSHRWLAECRSLILRAKYQRSNAKKTFSNSGFARRG